jgi:hypothetical protein
MVPILNAAMDVLNRSFEYYIPQTSLPPLYAILIHLSEKIEVVSFIIHIDR